MKLETTTESLDTPPASISKAVPSVWDADLVGKRLVQAFVTLDRLPRLRGPREPGGHWPRTVTEWADQLAQAELDESERLARERASNRVVIRPTAAGIAHMEAAFEWLRELRLEDPGLALVTTLWALRTARGRSIKALCVEKQWGAAHLFPQEGQGLGMVGGDAQRAGGAGLLKGAARGSHARGCEGRTNGPAHSSSASAPRLPIVLSGSGPLQLLSLQKPPALLRSRAPFSLSSRLLPNHPHPLLPARPCQGALSPLSAQSV